MAYLQISNVKSQVIFAFPGMGKTPYCQTHKGCVDADFGYFRDAMKVKKDNEEHLLSPWFRVCEHWLKDDYIIFLNEPKMMKFFNPRHTICILPIDLRYSAKKMKVSESVISH